MSILKLSRKDNSKNYILTSAISITFIVIFLLLLGVYGYRFNIFSAGYSLLFLTKYAIYLSIIAFSLALISIGYSLKLNKKIFNFLTGAFVLSFNLTIISFFYFQVLDLRSNPLINDISTDYSDLLEFKVSSSHILPENDHHLIQKYGGFKLPNYDLKPLLLSGVSKEVVFNNSLVVIQKMGLEVIYKSLEEGKIEALDKSFWYRFKDDMIIQIEELISGKIMINVRSASRTGKSDFGKNSQRIRNYFNLIKKEIALINK